MTETASSGEEHTQGSWAPLLLVLVLLLLRWFAYETSSIPVRVRRFYNMQVRRQTNDVQNATVATADDSKSFQQEES
jgi:hypothetical protein